MKKILVVDDNKNNRLTLLYILEDWEEEHRETKLEVSFAEDGKVAVEMCEKDLFDIILMDIMMPVMDGIEATTLIRAGQNKSALIIACSALSDNEHKNKIITAGAEDYITKPIDSDLFSKRFTNYIGLVKNRKAQPFNPDAENVINNEVYYRKTQFIIKNEVALSEFWEYFLLDSTYADREEFADMIRLLYGLGNYQLKKNYNFSIFLEESDDNVYITMDNVVLLTPSLVEGIVKKNYSNGDYKIMGNKISFSIGKVCEVSVPIQKEEKIEEVKVEEVKSVIESTPAPVAVVKEAEVVIQTYDFMDVEDISEIEEIAGEMRSLISLVGSASIEDDDIELLSFHIQKFATVLSVYTQTYSISSAMKQLSSDIIENMAQFKAQAKDISMLCEAFNRDLFLWINKLFYEGAPSIDFLDSSIISNANMITSFIKEPEEVAEETFDDIFDF
ncbi:MAG TPA: response regulator [Campylobacterales bacterium]|nr:response regulator [Campylobacterales bacterium]